MVGRRVPYGLLGARPDREEDAPVEADHDDAGNVEGGERGPEDEGGVVEDAEGALALGRRVQAEYDGRPHAAGDEPDGDDGDHGARAARAGAVGDGVGDSAVPVRSVEESR